MKLRIKENVNMMDNDIYDKFCQVALLCHLGFQNLLYMHWNCVGSSFEEIHNLTQESSYMLQSFCDRYMELAMEGNISKINPINAIDSFPDYNVQDKEQYNFKDVIEIITDIYTDIIESLTEIVNLPSITSDIKTGINSDIRRLTSEINYRNSAKLS